LAGPHQSFVLRDVLCGLALGVFKQAVLTKTSQAIAFFDKEFVKNGNFSGAKAFSRSLHLGFDQRQVMITAISGR